MIPAVAISNWASVDFGTEAVAGLILVPRTAKVSLAYAPSTNRDATGARLKAGPICHFGCGRNTARSA